MKKEYSGIRTIKTQVTSGGWGSFIYHDLKPNNYSPNITPNGFTPMIVNPRMIEEEEGDEPGIDPWEMDPRIMASLQPGGVWLIVQDPSTKKFLLAKRSQKANNPGLWNFFGGGIDPNEAPLDSLIREVKEECGINVTKSEVKAIGKIMHPRVCFFFQYVGSMSKIKNIKLNEEHTKAKWISYNKLLKTTQSLNRGTRLGLLFLGKIIGQETKTED